MWDGRDFMGAKMALILGGRTIVYKRDDIAAIPFPGLWDLPGGGREGAESPLDCAIREVAEEFGLIVDTAAVSFGRAYRDHRYTESFSYFFVAELDESCAGEVRFGDEGECWAIDPISDFLAPTDAVPHLQDRLRDWLACRNER